MLPLSQIPFPDIDAEIFRIGPLALRWYGLAYITGFVAGYALLVALARRGRVRVPPAAIADLVTWVVVAVLIGGRAGWWIFYHRDTGEPQPWYEPFAVWHGGMSFHGALVGVAIAMLLWCRLKTLPFWSLADGAALVVPIGLFTGRIANFINAELVGRPTDLPWGVIFPGDAIARHPSQLYEAILEGPVLMAIMWLVMRHRRREGQVAAMFLIVYGMARFAVEFTREPDPQVGFVAFGWLTMGQLLSAVLVFAGIAMLLWRFAPAAAEASAPTEPPTPDASP
jgi:phosphatidylglycerol---prolipoprotein diacylglyceryl transferase